MAQQDMGLFGPSAAEVQRALDDRARLSNLEQAKLDPYQSIRLSMANYGTAAGKAIGGLFGIEDPALKEATEMDAVKKVVASQWDGQDPEKALQLFADEANKRGLTQQALSATFKLQSMKAEREKAELGKIKTSYEIGKIAAQTQEALRKAQQAAAAKVPSLIQYQEARDAIDVALQTEQDPQARARLEARWTELNNYITKESTREPKDKTPPSVGSDREAIAQELFGKGFYQLTQQEIVAVNKKADERAEKTKPSVNVTVEGEKSFAKQMGEEDAKAVVEARKLSKTAVGELESLNEMARRNQQNITSGTFASGRVGVANFFNTIGLLGANDVKKLANSEVYTKSAGDLVLAKIKALGSNPSNADREFIVRIVPQLENSPQARAELISYLQKRANDVIKESSSLESYARQNKGLSGYVPTIPLTISPQTAKKASDMTDQELIDAYKSGRR